MPTAAQIAAQREIAAHRGEIVDGVFVRQSGLGWLITTLFVIGELAGGGLIALPISAARTGVYVCLVMIVIFTLVMGYTGHLLGQCWIILVERWPKYRTHCRKPYPSIALRAMGPKMRVFVSICLNITQFGVCVVYLLLVSRNIHDLSRQLFDWNIGYCWMVIFVAVALLPVSFLKSPQDFWGAVIVGMFTSALATVFILVGTAFDLSDCAPYQEVPQTTARNFFLSVATFLFSYGGHSGFPTIQHDMRRPADFSKSVILAYIAVSLFFAPVAALGFFAYGDSLRHSILPSIQWMAVQHAVNICITVHCVLTITVALNPLNQELEDVVGISQKFGLQRMALRSTIMATIVFVALSVPSFAPMLDLIGGSTLTLTSLVFPCLFYLFLAPLRDVDPKKMDVDERIHWKRALRENSPLTVTFCLIIIVSGLLIGFAATYSALSALSTTHFVAPCYVQPFLSEYIDSHLTAGSVHCCGHWQNITTRPDVQCAIPNLRLYD